ncbi:HAMP domain-containing histidine kinase [Catenovulum sp. SM1970]|uniref:ATP-binding protein n=1 Tax=Marinifaba aquimaris TaxID=2741323 RepID=UPI001572CCBD|nr:HAMP domain-containing histidine kinase [Marinifaba aquimaris]
MKREIGTVKDSISVKLLGIVLSIYLLLTLVVTGVHIMIDYYNAKEEVQVVLTASEKTFHDILVTDLWNYDYQQLEITAKSLLGLPHVVGIELITAEQETIVSSGKTLSSSPDHEGLFHYTFPLIKILDGELNEIGSVKLYSDDNFIINSIKPGIYLLAFNAAIKTIAIFILISIVFKHLLTNPLGRLARQAGEINPNEMQSSLIDIAQNPDDELGVLQKALNDMIEKTAEVIGKLDFLNKDLELRVKQRTEELQQTVEQLHVEQDKLVQEVEVRQRSEAALEKSLEELKFAQGQLIESEKMASLGGLVAGVAHEINTPVGLSLTGISHFQVCVEDVAKLYDAGDLEEDQFEKFIKESKELSSTIHNSLQRAANLVRSFKLVAVDQSAEEIRQFDLIEYLDETMISLNNKIKQSKLTFTVNSQEKPLVVNNYPGSWAQIFTNLIQNTMIHAYEPQSAGQVQLNFSKHGDTLHFEFIDDGKGMTEETQKKVFEPFYTTNRANGGSGLGMNILFNIVTQKMYGTISLHSAQGLGSKFIIEVPIDISSYVKGG